MPHFALSPCMVTRCLMGAGLAAAVFAYATWGDFSWLRLSGPWGVTPDLAAEEARYTATPAVRHCMAYGVFFLLSAFFACIPRLSVGLWRNAPYLACTALATLLGTLAVCGSPEALADGQSADVRIAGLVGAGLFLCASHDTRRLHGRALRLPRPLGPRFFAALALLLGLSASVALGVDTDWLTDADPALLFARFLALLACAVAAGLYAASKSRGGAHTETPESPRRP